MKGNEVTEARGREDCRKGVRSTGPDATRKASKMVCKWARWTSHKEVAASLGRAVPVKAVGEVKSEWEVGLFFSELSSEEKRSKAVW